MREPSRRCKIGAYLKERTALGLPGAFGEAMLTEKRQEEILKLLETLGSVTVQELKERLNVSESTIRRDLNELDEKGALIKVFGGAVQAEPELNTTEEMVSSRLSQNREEKERIGRYAASLIEPGDFVYLDAGTTTGAMIPFLEEKDAFYVTNAVSHALQLAGKGFRVTLTGGEVKAATEAMVGNEAYVSLQKYNFTKGFFGANGVSRAFGFTTPDVNEAMIKECAIRHTRKPYILCDSGKFHQVSTVTFAAFEDAAVITDCLPKEGFKGADNLLVAGAEEGEQE